MGRRAVVGTVCREALSLDELFPPDRERKETGMVVRRNKII